jgi:hypothetical protein
LMLWECLMSRRVLVLSFHTACLGGTSIMRATKITGERQTKEKDIGTAVTHIIS